MERFSRDTISLTTAELNELAANKALDPTVEYWVDRAKFANALNRETIQYQGSVDGAGNSGSLLVSGTPGVGNTLTASFPMGVGTVKWTRLVSGDWTDISGGTNLTYIQVAADAGTQVRPVATSYAPFGGATNVPGFPIGSGYDIVVIWGQSNGAGRGAYDPAIDTTDPRVFQFDGWPASGTYRTIIPGSDPLKHPEGSSLTGVGFGMFFAKQYAAATGRKVLLVPCAWGGTRLTGSGTARWDPLGNGTTNDLYVNAIAQTNLAITAAKTEFPDSKFVGALGLQGETDGDGGTSQAAYESALVSLISGVRAGITDAANSWFVMGQMVPEGIAIRGSYANINAGHKHVGATIVGTTWVPVGPGYDGGDQLHYNAAGQRAMGKLFADNVAAAISRTTNALPGPMRFLAVYFSAGSATVQFDPPVGGGVVTDYVIQYKLRSAGGYTVLSDGVSSFSATAVISGLVAASQYDVQVAAVSAGGTGPFTTVSGFTKATPVDSFVRFGSLTGGITETGSAGAGFQYQSPAGSASAFATQHCGVADKKIAAGTVGRVSGKLLTTGATSLLGLVAANTDPNPESGATGFKFAILNFGNGSGSYYVKDSGSSQLKTTNVVTNLAWVGGTDDFVLGIEDTGNVYAAVIRAGIETRIHNFGVYAGDLWPAYAVQTTTATARTFGPIVGSNIV